MIPFDMGIPDFKSLIVVKGYGVCQLRKHFENGDVLLYVGGNRLFTVGGHNLWRYVR